MNFTSSIFDNVKDRTTNPFFGSLIFVWLVRNWDLVYTVFNFDSDCNLEDKKEFIRNYYANKVLWQEIVFNISIAFGLMVLSYGLIIISRLVVNVTNHNIIPRMNDKTVSKLVVNKARFETVKKTRDEYFVKIQDFEEQVIALEQKNSLSKKENIENRQRIRELNHKSGMLEADLELVRSNFSKSKEEFIENEKRLEELEHSLAMSKDLVRTYDIENVKFRNDVEDFNEIILNYLNFELDVENLISDVEIKIPSPIYGAYLDLNRESFELKSIDDMFFSIASHLRDDSEKKDRTSFNADLIKTYLKIGLVKLKKDVVINYDVDYKSGKNIEISVIGRIVADTEGIYKILKNKGII